MAYTSAAVAFNGAVELITERPFMDRLFKAADDSEHNDAAVSAFKTWFVVTWAGYVGNMAAVFDAAPNAIYKQFMAGVAKTALQADLDGHGPKRQAEIDAL